MRKFVKVFLSFILLFISADSVLAFNYDDVNISEEIGILNNIEANMVKIQLKSDLKNNNDVIYYQFIETTSAVINGHKREINEIKETYNSCDETAKRTYDYEPLEKNMQAIKARLIEAGDDYTSNDEYIAANNNYTSVYNQYISAANVCIANHNNSLKELYEDVPLYDDNNWQEKSLDSEGNNLLYNVPADAGYYWLWIKAKDADNNDIYQIVYVYMLDDSSSAAGTSRDDENTQDAKPQVLSSSSNKVVKVPATGANARFIIMGLFAVSVVVGICVYMIILKGKKE